MHPYAMIDAKQTIMKRRRAIPPILLFSVLTTWIFGFTGPSSVLAQKKAPNIVQSYGLTVNAISRGEFKTAVQYTDNVIKEYGSVKEGKEQFGPVYGHWFYLRGLAYIGLKRYDEASKDFETCYNCVKFTEKILSCKKCFGRGRIPSTMPVGSRDKDAKMPCTLCGGIPFQENKPPNLFRMHSLVQWGNCRMIVKDYPGARDLYKKVLKEDRSNKLNRTWKQYVSVNLGRCLIKSGQPEEGYNYVINVLDNPRFGHSLKQTIFLILADDWSPLATPERTREFVAKYRHIPLTDRLESRVKRNDHFFFLANKAIEKNDPVLALNWFRLITHPGQLLTEIKSTKASYTAMKEAEKREERIELLEAEITKLSEQQNKMKQNLWGMLAGNGMAHFMIKNFAASFTVYRELSDHAPKTHKGRPEFLHNTVVSGVQIGDWTSAYTYGKMFLDEFPEHDLKPNIVRILVEIVFINGDYQEAYDLSGEVRVDMKVGSEIRDIPDFIFGASAYQLGKIEQAEAELTDYLANYPEAKREELARYFLGSSKLKGFKWEEASGLFDPFLNDYPTSAMLSSVLYQNGMCKFMLDDNETALPLIVRLLEEFPNAQEVPTGWNLRGDIQSVLEADFDSQVAVAYNNAITTAANFPGQDEVPPYARWQMMMSLASQERWEEAGKYYDAFQEIHPDSGYRIDMLIGALETLVELDRTEEAINRQEALLFASSDDPRTEGLSSLFGTYLDFLQEHAPEQANEKLQALFTSPQSSISLRAWAQVGQIEILEKAEGDNQIQIQALFEWLNNDFKPELHANYVITRLARWLNLTQNKPDEAHPLYTYILDERIGTDGYELALLDRAQIDALSDKTEDQDRAMASFERLLAEFDSAEITETANVGISRLLMDKQKFAEALPKWEAYMDNPNWTKFSAEANYNYAVALDRTGKVDDALVVYINTYNAFPGHADFSTPSYLRAALIMKGKGEDLKALMILKDMLTRLQNIEHPNKDKGLELFQKWRAEYVPPKQKAK